MARRAGDLPRAGALYWEAIPCFQQVGQPLSIVHCLEGLAAVSAAEGHAALAVRLLSATGAQRSLMDAPLSAPEQALHDQALVALQADLGPDAYAGAVEEGRMMALDEVIAAALNLEAVDCAS